MMKNPKDFYATYLQTKPVIQDDFATGALDQIQGKLERLIARIGNVREIYQHNNIPHGDTPHGAGVLKHPQVVCWSVTIPAMYIFDLITGVKLFEEYAPHDKSSSSPWVTLGTYIEFLKEPVERVGDVSSPLISPMNDMYGRRAQNPCDVILRRQAHRYMVSHEVVVQDTWKVLTMLFGESGWSVDFDRNSCDYRFGNFAQINAAQSAYSNDYRGLLNMDTDALAKVLGKERGKYSAEPAYDSPMPPTPMSDGDYFQLLNMGGDELNHALENMKVEHTGEFCIVNNNGDGDNVFFVTGKDTSAGDGWVKDVDASTHFASYLEATEALSGLTDLYPISRIISVDAVHAFMHAKNSASADATAPDSEVWYITLGPVDGRKFLRAPTDEERFAAGGAFYYHWVEHVHYATQFTSHKEAERVFDHVKEKRVGAQITRYLIRSF